MPDFSKELLELSEKLNSKEELCLDLGKFSDVRKEKSQSLNCENLDYFLFSLSSSYLASSIVSELPLGAMSQTLQHAVMVFESEVIALRSLLKSIYKNLKAGKDGKLLQAQIRGSSQEAINVLGGLQALVTKVFLELPEAGADNFTRLERATIDQVIRGKKVLGTDTTDMYQDLARAVGITC